jgi:hypothetical protein
VDLPESDLDMVAHTERIASSLEPELRRVIDVTMARVAELEQATRQEARGLLESTEEDSQDALERSNRLVANLEALTGTVTEVTSTLRTEVDEVTEALRDLKGSRVRLPEQEPPPRSVTEPAPSPAEPAAAEPVVEPTPAPAIDPAPEMEEMYRQHITRMRADGKSRKEARRIMRRYAMGHRFMWMVDDIYMHDGSTDESPSGGGRIKRFFTRV